MKRQVILPTYLVFVCEFLTVAYSDVALRLSSVTNSSTVMAPSASITNRSLTVNSVRVLGGITITSNSSSPTMAPTVPEASSWRRSPPSVMRLENPPAPPPPHHLEFGGSEAILATGGPVKHVRPVGAGFAVDGAVKEERPSAFVDPSCACV